MKKNNSKVPLRTALLFMLGIVVIVSLAVSISAMVLGKKNFGDSRSGQAYRSARDGVEDIMSKFLGADQNLPVSSIGDCSKQEGSKYAVINGNDYQVELKKQDENEETDCDMSIKEVFAVKSVGNDGELENQGILNGAIDPALAATGSGCYVSYKDGCSGANCCLSGFNNKGSLGTWGYCHGCGQADCTSWFVPPGGNCNYSKTNNGTAYLCCTF